MNDRARILALKEALPEATAEFREDCLERGLSPSEARAEWTRWQCTLHQTLNDPPRQKRKPGVPAAGTAMDPVVHP